MTHTTRAIFFSGLVYLVTPTVILQIIPVVLVVQLDSHTRAASRRGYFWLLEHDLLCCNSPLHSQYLSGFVVLRHLIIHAIICSLQHRSHASCVETSASPDRVRSSLHLQSRPDVTRTSVSSISRI